MAHHHLTTPAPRLLASLVAVGVLGAALAAGIGPARLPSARAAASTYDIVISPLGSGADAIVEAVAADATSLYAAGAFSTVDGVPADSLARYNIAAGTWSSLGSFSMNPSVLALDPSSGVLYAGGAFLDVNGLSNTAFIAKWDGSSWTGFGDASQNLGARVFAIDVAPNGDVYVGGQFNLIEGGARSLNFVARWDSATSLWMPLGTGVDGTVRAIEVDSMGRVYVAGTFANAGGQPASRIAMWDGTTWRALGSGLSATANASLAIDSQDRVYVGGEFATAGGVTVNGIAAWDGTSWSALGSGVLSGSVFDLAIDSADQLYVAGGFVTARDTGGNWVNGTQYFARWDGTQWQGTSQTMNSSVASLAIGGTSGTIYLGGSFTATNPATAPLNNLAAVQPGPTISSITPARVPTSGGTDISIRGAALKGATLGISIGGLVPDNVAVVSESLITATTKPASEGSATVALSTPAGSATTSLEFVNAPAPAVLSPSRAATIGGDTITITGTDLADVTAVTFGGVAGTNLSVSDTQVQVTTPAHDAGVVDVEVRSQFGDTRLLGAFRFTGAPSAPQGLRQSGRIDRSLKFTWSAPTSDGGAEITGYTVQYRKHGAAAWKTKPGAITGGTTTISNLRDGTKYDVRVAATNGQTGEYTTASGTTPAVPAAPTSVRARARGTAVTVNWKRAAVQSGSSRTANLVMCRKGRTKKTDRVSGTATSASLALGRGTWSCQVFTYTQAGRGPGSRAVRLTIP